MAETTEEERSPRILVPSLEKDRNPIYTHRVTVLSSVHSTPPSEGSQGGNELQQPVGYTESSLAGDHS